MRDAIRLRYSLSPYIYTSAREAFDTGISICRPLYYDHPEVPEALWTYDGANLTMKIYLPESDISECLTVDCRFPEFSPEKIALLDGAKGRIGRMRKFAPEAKMAFGIYVDRICKMPDSFLAILQCGSFITEDPHGAPAYLSEFDPSAALDDLESIGQLPPDFIVRLRAQLIGE